MLLGKPSIVTRCRLRVAHLKSYHGLSLNAIPELGTTPGMPLSLPLFFGLATGHVCCDFLRSSGPGRRALVCVVHQPITLVAAVGI